MVRRHKENVPMPFDDSLFLAQIYSQHNAFMLKAAMVYAKDEGKAEDVLHDAIIRLIAHTHKLRGLDNARLCSYLRTTVKAAALDAIRKEKPYVPLSDEVFQNLADREHELEPDLFMRWEIRRLRETLTPREWMVLEGKYILGYSNAEIAQLIGIAPNSIRMTLSRICKKSREILQTGV